MVNYPTTTAYYQFSIQSEFLYPIAKTTSCFIESKNLTENILRVDKFLEENWKEYEVLGAVAINLKVLNFYDSLSLTNIRNIFVELHFQNVQVLD
jgi:hypothetical protein